MNYQQYILYHLQGDAGVEERLISKLKASLNLDDWGAFRLVYYYSTTYNIQSALKLLENPDTDKKELKFRTDRRYVRIAGNYERMMKELNVGMLNRLKKCTTTTQAYEEVLSWFFFGRYAAFLFLECWLKCYPNTLVDDLKLKWEANENYTKGAEIVVGSKERSRLDKFIESAKRDTKDNVFSLETSLCAVEKIRKGTRWNGYYTERMLKEAYESKYATIIYQLAT